MKTRWMMVGSLLTLGALVMVAVLGGVAMAQQETVEATPEPPVTQNASGHFGAHFARTWHLVGDADDEGVADNVGR